MPLITINITAQQATRLAAAWQKQFDMDAPPTLADVRQHLVRELKAIVHSGEKKAAEEAASAPAPFDPT